MKKKEAVPDPTEEEIWGTETTIGLAEQIRLERPQRPDREPLNRPSMIRECNTKMLPFGVGKTTIPSFL